MLIIIALSLINAIFIRFVKLIYDERHPQRVNWPHVYELEHEVWPEIKHPRNHSFNVTTDCRKCFNETRRDEGKATPFKTTNQSAPILVKMPPDPGYHRPSPPSYIPVRTSNEPLVATYSVNAPLAQTIAFETQRVRFLGEVNTLLLLLEWYDPKPGYCFWVREIQQYFVWVPYHGWKRYGEIVGEAIDATDKLLHF